MDSVVKTLWRKHRVPECDNVQAKIDGFGMCKELVTGIPGGMNDAFASRYLCRNDAIQVQGLNLLNLLVVNIP